MDNVGIKNFSKIAIMIFNKQCGNSLNCGIPFNSFASQSNFLELSDNEIREILDYCIKENIFKETDGTFWLTIIGQIKIQEILEEIGYIKMIYYVEDQNISLSDRLLLFLSEQSPMDLGLLRVNFHNFTEIDILSALNDLLSRELIIHNDNNIFSTSLNNYKDIYKFFGFKNISITVEGKRKAYELLKNPKISCIYKLPTLEDDKRFEIIEQIIKSLRRFHLGANSLEKHRRAKHNPYIISDEYDVQDLLFSFLLINFPDADMEDPGGKIAGVSTRSDIVIQNLKVIIEIKLFKEGNGWTNMFKDINHKIQTYSQKDNYDHIIIFIYNPDLALKNPNKIEKDITNSQNIGGKEFQVITIIDPK